MPPLYADSPRSPERFLEAAITLDRVANGIAALTLRLRAGGRWRLATEEVWALATSDGFCRGDAL
ncbi:hypothetical protein ACRAWD_22280 [Caulobacter segnis]